ncbi:MAG: SpoIID/LytB domain-containing protein [Candidatus Omnitrophica bacterium]|nr:SpoIID/LytB domain-containing protein [Candidatus Omnitrophota bacterium]
MPNKRLVQIGLICIAAIGIFRFFYIPFKLIPRGDSPCIVRVRIVKASKAPVIKAKKRCDISDISSGRVLRKNMKISESVEIRSVHRRILIGKNKFNSRALRVSPRANGAIEVDGVLYRGCIDVIKTGGVFSVINRVKIEDYLLGVLPREVNFLWPFEMMKTQAIASRSYAVYESMRRKNEEYDLTNDTFSQMYGGKSDEKWRTSRAVKATEGEVLEYKGEVFPAYYHASCGGHTQDIANVWGGELEPLRGTMCNWCRWTPYYRWQVKVPAEKLGKKLKEKGYPILTVEAIKEGTRDNSGRLEHVIVKSDNRWFEIETEDFRSAGGRKSLKSANFRIKKYPFFYLFSGYGWGHGVGMCQWGAFSMSLRRYKCEKILKTYYPGTKIVKLKEI